MWFDNVWINILVVWIVFALVAGAFGEFVMPYGKQVPVIGRFLPATLKQLIAEIERIGDEGNSEDLDRLRKWYTERISNRTESLGAVHGDTAYNDYDVWENHEYPKAPSALAAALDYRVKVARSGSWGDETLYSISDEEMAAERDRLRGRDAHLVIRAAIAKLEARQGETTARDA